MIGIIFNSKKYEELINNKTPLVEKTGRENFRFYTDLANEFKVNVCFYSIKHFTENGQKVRGAVYSHKKQKLQKKVVPVPKVNICRHTSYNQQTISQMRNIEKKQKVQFLNMMTSQKNKYTMEKKLREEDHIGSHIPKSIPLTFNNLVHNVKKYNKVIVKPRIGNKGRNVFMIEKKQNKYIAHLSVKQMPVRKTMNEKQLQAFYRQSFATPSTYFIQQFIPILPYKGKKFDLRVNVQKGSNEHWQVTAIVSKIAQKGGIITNASQGGTPRPGAEVDSVLEESTKTKINQLSIHIAEAIEKMNPRVTDLGLDIAVDKNQKPWFLEANFRSQKRPYISFCGLDTWMEIQRPPFEYACALYQRRKRK